YATAFQADTKIGTPLFRNALDVAENAVRTKEQLSFTVATDGLRKLNGDAQLDPKLASDLESQLSAVGYKVELGAKYKGYVPVTDAPIAMYRGSVLYFGGTTKATISIQAAAPSSPRIERANLPVDVDRSGKSVSIEWKGKGMQQAKVYAPRGLEVLSEGWSSEKSGDGKHYVLTRYGDMTTLKVRFK
ncbi:MAG: hypothetical protein J7559_01345, partial [Cohnella sp.]|nr:hypothetical protein [Cohnella sp.]